MNKTLCLIFFCFFIFPVHSFAQDTEKKEFDFRQVRWGMSMAEVKKAETKAKLVAEDPPDEVKISQLVYDTELNNCYFFLVYAFVDDKLCGAHYQLNEKFSNKSLYVEMFNTFKSQLTSLYGEPGNDETIWYNNYYKDKPEKLGQAYTQGDVRSKIFWDKDDLMILMDFFGNNYDINFFIIYASKKYEAMFEEARSKKMLSDL